ncbi:MAG: hypothetical protein R3B99_35115 [Polyangiales bacterium]|nr:hypothetical protein [Myxococcales bacterium]
MHALDRLARMLDDVLPVRGERVLLARDEEAFVVGDDGWIDVPVLVAETDTGEIREVAAGHAAHHVHLEDLEPEHAPRTRAFLAGWAEAWSRAFRDEPSIHLDWLLARATVPHLLDDLRLQSKDDFAHEVAAARWLDSGPDWATFPDLAKVPVARASDVDWERRVAAGDEPLFAYARWLDAQGDPRGTATLAAHAPTRHAWRRARGVREEHAEYFFGPFPDDVRDGFAEVELVFEGGFAAELAYYASRDVVGPTPAEVLDAALRLPSTRFVRVVRLAPDYEPEDGQHPLACWSDALTRGSDTVRELHLVRSASMHAREDEAKLRRLFPRLRVLNVEDAR